MFFYYILFGHFIVENHNDTILTLYKVQQHWVNLHSCRNCLQNGSIVQNENSVPIKQPLLPLSPQTLATTILLSVSV